MKGIAKTQRVDRGWDRIKREMRNINGASVKIGVLAEEGFHEDSSIHVAQLGAVHEFGAPRRGIPERSFLRATADAKQVELNSFRVKELASIQRGTSNVRLSLERLGQRFKDMVISTINQGIPPPNKPATVARKGSSKTLIDTGQLKQSIRFKVEGA